MQSLIYRFLFVDVPVFYNEEIPNFRWIDNVATITKIVDPSSPILIFCHGNGSDISSLPVIAWLSSFGYNYCIVEYPGYGLHKDTPPSEDGCIDHLYRVTSSLYNEGYQNLIYVGHSMGCGVAVATAAKYNSSLPILGLVLYAPFLSAVKVVLPFSLFIDAFPNYQYVSSIDKPIAIYHGEADEVIAVSHALSLAELVKDLYDLILIPNINHTMILFDAETVNGLTRFVQSVSY